MSNIKYFFKDNEDDMITEDVIVSERFKDEDGNPIPWTIRQIPQKEIDTMREDCTTKKMKKGIITENVDENKLQKMIIVNAVSNPNLKDAELLANRGFKDPKKMLAEMLFVGENATLTEAVLKLNKLDDEEIITEAKN